MSARAGLQPGVPSEKAVVVKELIRQQVPARSDAGVGARLGFLVASSSLEFLYGNETATQILTFPRNTADPAIVSSRLKSILSPEQLHDAQHEAAFMSGRRRYVCRQFPLDVRPRHSTHPVFGLIMERPSADGRTAARLQRRFHLSPREFESVQYLIQGLTTKEVATLMHVSPNTVKQYIRLVMSKMGVTTRAGIVGKFLAG
jgi:DNA-binding CsgD family transcriptional regulator